MKAVSKFLLSGILLLSLCSFSSCAADLGSGIKNEETYGDTYEINFLTSERKKLYTISDLDEGEEGKPITDFYNKDTVNDFDCCIDYDSYRYLIIHPTRTVSIDEMYIYVNVKTAGVLQCRAYLTDHIPNKLSNLQNLYESFKEYLEEKKTNPDLEEFTFDYGDEPSSSPVATSSKKIDANKWTDIGFTKFEDAETHSKKVTVTSSQYLLIQFYNNCENGVTVKSGMTLEDLKAQVEERKKNQISLKTTNIMIHDAS